ncbi:unnamed protein product [Didymodactylos carnosus]|uniref:Uncharacterized protein n=1 Tax=Didymodactylos carnosus TaxID=1234261 RepID=A0A813VJ15_9BILA|nr:unnamed protein product [Didymodactylos carnosus]CAF3625606.1 unnamed protein product [Didymodactylos carnosus]
MLSSHAMQPPLSNYSPLAQYPMPYAPLSNLPVNSPFVNPYQMYPSNCQCYDCSVAVSQSMWLPPPI